MKQVITALLLGAAVLGGLMSAQPARAAGAILFVLDSSNSMWGQVEGQAKIAIAKEALGRLLSDVPGDARVGLMVYGHRDSESCEDVELVLPLGAADAGAAQAALKAIQPRGKTPIAYALAQSAEAFGAAGEGEQRSVVLISDGIETCEGDPCAVAGRLAANEIETKVHVVGFDISEKDRAALECIAEEGKGRYFAADSTEGFKDAVSQAVAQVAEQPASEPESEVVYEDEFEGNQLSEDWVVNNPDPEAYIVEGGQLLMVGTGEHGLYSDDAPNVITLQRDLPSGDFDLNTTVFAELQTNRDHLWFGLYKDPKNYMAIQLWTEVGSTCSRIVLRLDKQSGGERTNFDSRIAGSGCGYGNDDPQAVLKSITNDGIRLTLSKRGRKYQAKATLLGVPGATTVTTEELTSLRLPGKPAYNLGKWDNVQGENIAFIERFEIVAVSE